MASTDFPWEPPFAGTEVEHLLGVLDRLRATFRWKADGLDAAGLRRGIGASSLTIGGLLKHLAFVEDYTFTVKLDGGPPGEPWQSAAGTPTPTGSSARRRRLPGGALRDLGRRRGRSRARLAAALASGGSTGRRSCTARRQHVSLRRLVCDLIEEYGRHTGHADLLREAVDGLVGEDPPPGWRPL